MRIRRRVLHGELEIGRGRAQGGWRRGDAEPAGVGQAGDMHVKELAREELRREYGVM